MDTQWIQDQTSEIRANRRFGEDSWADTRTLVLFEEILTEIAEFAPAPYRTWALLSLAALEES